METLSSMFARRAYVDLERDRLIDAKEAREILGISANRLYLLMYRRDVRVFRIGHLVRFLHSNIIVYGMSPEFNEYWRKQNPPA